MEIKILEDKIHINDVAKMAEKQFGDVIKATIDITKEIMALGGDLHADEEAVLLDNGSSQTDLWGINLYPANFKKPDFIEYDSMINIRPSQNNRSRSVEDHAIRDKIENIVYQIITK